MERYPRREISPNNPIITAVTETVDTVQNLYPELQSIGVQFITDPQDPLLAGSLGRFMHPTETDPARLIVASQTEQYRQFYADRPVFIDNIAQSSSTKLSCTTRITCPFYCCS